MIKESEETLVSVVIPTWNRAEMVQKCVESVLQSDYENIEVIVIDNNSTDKTLDVLKEKYHYEPRLKVYKLKENLMAAGGRNAGFSCSSGEYILILDNDNIVYPDMISKLLEAFSKKKEASFIGALSINVKSNTIWVLQGGYQNFWTSRTYAFGQGLSADSVDDLDDFYETMGAPNAFMIKRDVLEKVGGFDEQFYAMYEEIDYAYRLKKAGMKAYLCTIARTSHYGYVADNQNNKLRMYGIETPERAYHFAKNRFIMEKRFAKWYQRLIFYVAFSNIYTFFYAFVAIKEKRKDIALAYMKGAFDGFRAKVDKSYFCKYDEYVDLERIQ